MGRGDNTRCFKSTGICFLTDSPGGEQSGFLTPFTGRDIAIPLFPNWVVHAWELSTVWSWDQLGVYQNVFLHSYSPAQVQLSKADLQREGVILQLLCGWQWDDIFVSRADSRNAGSSFQELSIRESQHNHFTPSVLIYPSPAAWCVSVGCRPTMGKLGARRRPRLLDSWRLCGFPLSGLD